MKRTLAALAAVALLSGCGGGEKSVEELQVSARVEVLAHCRTEVEKQLGQNATWAREQIQWAEAGDTWTATVTGFATAARRQNYFKCVADVNLAEGEVISKTATVEPR